MSDDYPTPLAQAEIRYLDRSLVRIEQVDGIDYLRIEADFRGDPTLIPWPDQDTWHVLCLSIGNVGRGNEVAELILDGAGRDLRFVNGRIATLSGIANLLSGLISGQQSSFNIEVDDTFTIALLLSPLLSMPLYALTPLEIAYVDLYNGGTAGDDAAQRLYVTVQHNPNIPIPTAPIEGNVELFNAATVASFGLLPRADGAISLWDHFALSGVYPLLPDASYEPPRASSHIIAEILLAQSREINITTSAATRAIVMR